MHPVLRRQLERHLGGEPAPELRALLEEVEAEYLRADGERTTLHRALDLLSDVIRRGAPAPAPAPPGDPAPAERPAPAPAAAGLPQRLFEAAPFPMAVCDERLRVVGWNAEAAQRYGWPQGDALRRELVELLFPEPDRAAAREALQRALARGEVERSLRVVAPRGSAPRLEAWTLVPLRAGAAEPAGVGLLVTDPLEEPDRSAEAVRAAGDVAWDWDLSRDSLWLSQTWEELTGVPPGPATRATWIDRVHPADRDGLRAALRAHLDGTASRLEHEHRLRRDDGEWRWVLARGTAERDSAGRATRLCGVLTDVTARRLASDRILHDALHDPLTRLPNRALFLDLVRRAFARSRRREKYAFAVLFLDLDHFKAVNDGHGHAAGDQLLLEVARRLQTCLREGDTLARLGGDEFTILLDDVGEAHDAAQVADRIHDAMARPFTVGAVEVRVSASVGIALSGPGYARAEDLLLDADTAMYRAKAQGRARAVLFDPTVRERSPELLEIEADLRTALVRREFRVHYLPIVEVGSGRILGLEALLRWAHPKRGLLCPAQFVSIADETGLLVPIGRWLLDQAGKEFHDLRRIAAPGALALHVNLSARQLMERDLVERVDEVVAAHQLEPGALVFEVTEATLQEGESAGARLAELRAHGVRLSVDDFGAEHSSLAALHRFPLDSLKIDQALFSGGAPHGRAPELVRTIVALARELKKPVVAEGVETAEQADFLRQLGCAAAQGYYFSPPLDGAGARALLARHLA